VRIALSGPAGSGKTTLMEYVVQNTSNPVYTPIYSPTERVYKAHGFNNEKDSLKYESQTVVKEIQLELFELCCKNIQDNENSIFDRCIIDVYIYTLLKCFTSLSKSEIDYLYDNTVFYARMYDEIFYLYPLVSTNLQSTAYRMYSVGQDYLFSKIYDSFYGETKGIVCYNFVGLQSLENRCEFLQGVIASRHQK